MLSRIQIPKHQQGATLIVALVFLLILTVAGVTAVRLSTTSEHMASNSQFRGSAFQLAQSELKAQVLNMSANIANRQPLLNSKAAPLEARPRFPERRAALALNTRIAAPNLNQTTNVNSLGGVDCLIFGDGTSSGKFNCEQFELTARSTLTSGAFSEQVSGLVMSTPK
ncbi:PilX N-terminal domain-containing pilus assembly protein [Pseudomonas sp. SL4(2022)]|uniref:pilus assembly PilX family protein n=1 Tax=Pseudomonas sp. SL4(2022) TaxID=2994661 RepID=UPI0022714495|nr:PilX N-terminal domain-containing pilus assembly protein [Pseudomonas sp. SL4(2022)]WAC42995.1 PilX N-terminal domain-containing pilus assembly protein [Pseudomonas sp. SL4(2022)]